MQCLLLAFVNINEFNIKERYRNVCIGKKRSALQIFKHKIEKE